MKMLENISSGNDMFSDNLHVNNSHYEWKGSWNQQLGFGAYLLVQ